MHEGHRKRLRQRFEQAAAGRGSEGRSQGAEPPFGEEELAELLLTYAIPRRDVHPIARELISRFGTLRAALAAPKEELESIPGLSENTSLFLKLIDVIAGRTPAAEDKGLIETPADPAPRTRLRSVSEAARYCLERFRGTENESVLQVLLDEDSGVIASFFVSGGGQRSVALPADIIAANARMHGAAGVVIAHNHPSGDIRPSVEDVAATRSLASMLQKRGTVLYEHVIVSESGCYAMLKGLDIKL